MLRLLLLLTFIIGCDDTYREDYPSITYEYNVDLPQDENGYYRMTLDREMWQTTQRIQGKVTSDSEWVDQIRINWESSHYWVLGDTLGYIYKECEVNTMIAPIKTMVGDTLRVTAWYIDFYQEITEKSINIILE
jgi:hypothetical protein